MSCLRRSLGVEQTVLYPHWFHSEWSQSKLICRDSLISPVCRVIGSIREYLLFRQWSPKSEGRSDVMQPASPDVNVLADAAVAYTVTLDLMSQYQNTYMVEATSTGQEIGLVVVNNPASEMSFSRLTVDPQEKPVVFFSNSSQCDQVWLVLWCVLSCLVVYAMLMTSIL